MTERKLYTWTSKNISRYLNNDNDDEDKDSVFVK